MNGRSDFSQLSFQAHRATSKIFCSARSGLLAGQSCGLGSGQQVKPTSLRRPEFCLIVENMKEAADCGCSGIEPPSGWSGGG
ncbi:unnamed protein product [Clavelina lepadiformis]|uniref:Uncharacterized protein n=1 Tax=Clavelina lepadiformis TaxID=159417 RepID=A0ABP0G4Y3_CLALP